MKQAIVRNVALFGGMGACGALCAAASPYLTSPRGAIGPSVFLAESPVAATTAIVISTVAAGVVAAIVARVVNAAVGMFVLGVGLFVLAGRLASVIEIAFGSAPDQSRMQFVILGFESLFWAALLLGATLLVFKIGGPLSDIQPKEAGVEISPIFSRSAGKLATAGVIMLPVVWFFARSTMTGQMLGATFLGGLLVGLVGRLLAPNVQPILLFVSPIAFGGVGHFISAVILKSPLDGSYVMGALPKWGLPMPVDYAAGSLMGVAMGVGWARSFLHHEDVRPETKTAPT